MPVLQYKVFREDNSEEVNTGILRRYMKMLFEKLGEVPFYQKIMASCVTEEMLVPNTNKIKIIIHIPKSLLDTEVTGLSRRLNLNVAGRAGPVWFTLTEVER